MSAALALDRTDPGRLSAPLLAAAVHLVLFAVLVLGVRWQNRPPETVTVELWEAPQPVAQPPAPAPRVEPPPPPKPEPRIEKPDIAVKEPPKPVPKPAPPKPVAKPEPLKPKVDESQRRFREDLVREQAELERTHIRDQLARETASASAKALATWIDKIRAKIKGNIVLPPDLKGNPEAIFDVVLLPDGTVLESKLKLRKSSGHAGYDAAVERAILKSSPLPRPDRPELFQRSLELRFRPVEDRVPSA